MADISIANAARLLRTHGNKVKRAIDDAVDGSTEDPTDAATDKEPPMSQADFSYPEKKVKEKAQEKGIVNSASADTSDVADKVETPPKRIRVKR